MVFSHCSVRCNRGKHNPHTTTTTSRDENAFLRPWERDVVAYMWYSTVRSFFTLAELLLSHPRRHSAPDKHPCQNKCHETEVLQVDMETCWKCWRNRCWLMRTLVGMREVMHADTCTQWITVLPCSFRLMMIKKKSLGSHMDWDFSQPPFQKSWDAT